MKYLHGAAQVVKDIFQSADKKGMEFYGSMEIIPWFSPSNSYIMITPVAGEVACGAKATFDIAYTFNAKTKNTNMKFFYLVIPHL